MSVTVLPAAALLFDLDGVLVDSREAVEAAWRRWAGDRGLDPAPFIAVAHGRRTSETIREVAPHLDAHHEAAVLDSLEAHITEGLRPVAGAAQLLAVLPQGRWAIVTSGSREVATLRLRHAGIPVPAVLVTGQDVPHGKPDPAGYSLGATRLGASPAECVAFEDTPAGVAAARAAGAAVIAVTTTYPAPRLSAATRVVDTLTRVRITSQGAGECAVMVES